MPEESAVAFHEGCAGGERHRTRDQPDQHAQFGPDPAAAERQAQEEDRPEYERQPTDPRERTAREACLEVVQVRKTAPSRRWTRRRRGFDPGAGGRGGTRIARGLRKDPATRAGLWCGPWRRSWCGRGRRCGRGRWRWRSGRGQGRRGRRRDLVLIQADGALEPAKTRFEARDPCFEGSRSFGFVSVHGRWSVSAATRMRYRPADRLRQGRMGAWAPHRRRVCAAPTRPTCVKCNSRRRSPAWLLWSAWNLRLVHEFGRTTYGPAPNVHPMQPSGASGRSRRRCLRLMQRLVGFLHVVQVLDASGAFGIAKRRQFAEIWPRDGSGGRAGRVSLRQAQGNSHFGASNPAGLLVLAVAASRPRARGACPPRT